MRNLPHSCNGIQFVFQSAARGHDKVYQRDIQAAGQGYGDVPFSLNGSMEDQASLRNVMGAGSRICDILFYEVSI